MKKIQFIDKSELHKSAALGLTSDIYFFLEIGIPVDTLDDRGYTALHYACECGRGDAVCLLVNRGADPKLTTPRRDSTLHLAAKSGSPYIIKVLHRLNVSYNERNILGRTPLHEAAAHGKEVAVRTLLSLGAPVSMISSEDLTPLHLAAREGHVEAARELLEAGALVEDCEVKPIHLAAEKGSVHIIQMLVERGADVMATTPNGDTPLHLALLKGNRSAAEALVRLGAKIEAEGHLGCKPLHCAVLGQPRVVSWLLSMGADPNPLDADGATPMTWAKAHNKERARILLAMKGGEEPRLKSKSNGYPPISVTNTRQKVESWLNTFNFKQVSQDILLKD